MPELQPKAPAIDQELQTESASQAPWKFERYVNSRQLLLSPRMEGLACFMAEGGGAPGCLRQIFA